MNARRLSRIRWHLFLVLATVARLSFAQPEPQEPLPGPPVPDGSPPAQLKYADVYLDDSFEANEMLDTARRLAAELRWEDAARLVDRLLSRYGAKLAARSPQRYRPIGDEVLEWVRGWPPEARAAYRRLFDEAAREGLAAGLRARDRGALFELLERYFCTHAAIDIADALGQWALEEGDFTQAARLYQRLWDQHPDAPAEAARIASRLAVIEALRGNADSARLWTAKSAAAGGATTRWMGQDRPLEALVESLLGTGLRPRAESGGFEWPIFGGEPSRNRVVDFTVKEAASLWRFDDLGSSLAAPPAEDVTGNMVRALENGRLLGINAIVARDLVILHDALQAWAVRSESGKPAWSYSAFDKETVRRSGRDGLIARWHAPTFRDGRVYLCMGSESVPYYGYDGQDLPSSLICLDADTGREIWRADRTGLEAAFSRCDFDSTPLVLEDKVFVVVRRRRSFGFEDCYLCRFDARTGRVEFRTHLGSASTGGFGFRRPTMSVPAFVDGDLVILTNLGTVARVSPWDGRVRWLTLYERQADGQGSAPGTEAAPWQFNPVLADEHRIIGLPLDSGAVLVIDPVGGEIRQSIPVSSLANAVSLLGLREGVLYGVGDEAFAYELESGKMRWHSPLPPEESSYGRGCLTANQMLIPTRTRLCVFSYAGEMESAVQWESAEDAGNVIATPDQLLVVAHDRVSAYARKQDVWDRLHARMAAAPDDPSPALDFAEVAIRGSDAAEALSALDEAVRRAGGFTAAVDPELRKRMFEDCLALADKVAGASPPDLDLAVKVLGYAAQCTPDLEADVTYRLRLAELHLRADRPEAAVELYQQMIADRSLRGVALPPMAAGGTEPTEARTAGALAGERIAQLIETHGAGIYARFEGRAADLVDAGVRDGDVALLDRAAETYPNADAGARALVEGGRLLRSAGKPLEAVRHLTRAYVRYGPRIDSLEVMRLIADAYADAGRPDSAWRWLTRAAREHPTAKIALGDRRVSLEEYRDRLGDLREAVEISRPHMNLPLGQTFVQEFDHPFELLEPLFADRPGARWDGYFVYADAQLQFHDAQGGAARWSEPAACRMTPDLLAATTERALFATRHQITALDPRDGREIWRYGKYPADLDDALADHERFDFFRAYGLGRDHLVSVQDDGRLVCLTLGEGRVVWETDAELRPSGAVVVSDLWAAYTAGQAGAQLLRVLNLETGEPISSVELSADRRAERLAVNLEDQLLAFSSQSITAFEPRTGERLWGVDRERSLLIETVQADLDGLYFSDNGRHLIKLGEGGRTLWQSDPLPGRPSDGLAVALLGAHLVVSTERAISALDGFDGRTVWEGTLPEDAMLGRRVVTDSYVLGVDTALTDPPTPFKAYFFDHRGGSGRLASEGGILELGVIADLRFIAVRDNAILVVTDKAIRGWYGAMKNGK